MAESDDLGLDDFEDEEDADADTDGEQKNPLRAVVKKLERKLKHYEAKVIPEREQQAVETFKRQQAKESQAKEVFEGFGFPGLASDYLSLHPDVEEVSADGAKEWLTARGLQPQEPPKEGEPPAQPPPVPTPAPVANFHATGGGTAQQGKVYTAQELEQAYRQNEISSEEFNKVIAEGRLKKESVPWNP